MKLHRLTVYIVDHDDMSAAECAEAIEYARYPNHCIAPRVGATATVDIGEWHDDHPANNGANPAHYFKDES